MKAFQKTVAIVLSSLGASAFAMDSAKELEPHKMQDMYKYEILKNIDFEPNRGKASSAVLEKKGSYPQGFYIDTSSNQLLVLRYVNKRSDVAFIDIYDWKNASYKKTIFLDNGNGYVSEGLSLLHKGSKQLIYVRGKNSLLEFEVSPDTKDGEKLSGRAVVHKDVAQSFSFYDGKLFIEKIASKKEGGDTSRGNYLVYDKGFEHIGSVEFDPKYAGTIFSQKEKSPKHQGFGAYSEGFVMSMGGYWQVGMPVNPYNYQGLNFFNNQGKLISSQYIKPDAMVEIIRKQGVVTDRIENEGVQVMEDGTIVTFNVIQVAKKQPGGLLFLKADSKDTDKKHLDLRPAAVQHQ